MSEALDLRIDRDADVPLGAQLAGRIRTALENRQLGPGDRLPSVRELAEAAGVNVNTARAVYARLESDGVVRSEQGRGTFVAAGRPAGEAAVRRDLRRQIAQLEAALVRMPPPRSRRSRTRLPAPRSCPPRTSRRSATACSSGSTSSTRSAPR